MLTVRSFSESARHKYPLLKVIAPDGKRFCCVPEPMAKLMDDIYNFEVRPDDVFVVTFPKSGTTWMQEAAWLIYNDLDFERASAVNLSERSIFMEASGVNPAIPNSVQQAQKLDSPRLLKLHLAAPLLPHQVWARGQRIIYVARNPKDTLVSFFHFSLHLGNYKGTLDEFVDDFLADQVFFGPYWPHLLDFWRLRHEPHILFVTYEDMKRDLAHVLQRVASFLGKPSLSETQVASLQQRLHFKSMRENERVNPIAHRREGQAAGKFNFMRRGEVGGFRDELSAAQQRRIDEWTERSLAGQGVTERDIFGDI